MNGMLKRYMKSEMKSFSALCHGGQGGGTNFSLVFPEAYNKLDKNSINNKDGFKSYQFPGQACYAKFLVPNRTTYSGMIGMIDYPGYQVYTSAKYRKRGQEDKTPSFSKEELSFMNFICKRSPLADAYLTKSGRRNLEIGSIKNVSFPAQYVIMSGQIVRNMHEWPDLMHRWYELRKYTDETTALVLAYCFRENVPHGQWGGAGGSCKKTYLWSPKVGEHSFFNFNYYGREGIKNFILNNKEHFEGRPPFSENVYFTNLACVWRGGWKNKIAPGKDAYNKEIITHKVFKTDANKRSIIKKTDLPEFIEHFKKVTDI